MMFLTVEQQIYRSYIAANKDLKQMGAEFTGGLCFYWNGLEMTI